MRVLLPLAALAAALALLWQVVPWAVLLHWVVGARREFQEAMARSLRAVQAGEPAAVASLCAATALYGLVHAAGPGHGKVPLGGAALASGATLRRMVVLTLASSLAQAATAIALAGALAAALRMGAMQVGEVANAWLAAASQAAIAAMSAHLVLRGVRMLRTPLPAQGSCDCGHAHGPTANEAASLTGWRDGTALVASIALRPCTGALLLLTIALRLDLFWIGALAVVAMGLGTAAFDLGVAGSGVLMRRAALIGASGADRRALAAGAHVIGGGDRGPQPRVAPAPRLTRYCAGSRASAIVMPARRRTSATSASSITSAIRRSSACSTAQRGAVASAAGASRSSRAR
jgi:ABC-type nickel/cobalt efflux system permease component RcnA